MMEPLAAHHHIAFTVSDRDVSAEWYRSVLGFDELFREDAPDRRACVMTFAGGGYSVGLVEHGAEATDRFDPTRTGLDHAAFSVASRDSLEAWAQRFDERDVAHSGVIDIPPGAILNFKDPDGIALALFWDRART